MAAIRPSLFTIIPYGENFLLFNQGVECFQYFARKKKCLLTGKEFEIPEHELRLKLDKSISNSHFIFHAFYELGDYLSHMNTGDRPLGLWLEYKVVKKLSSLGHQTSPVKALWNKVDFNDYKKSFNLGLKHLLRGDCYQYNLTRLVTGKLKGSSLDLLRRVWDTKKKRGAYGSFTYSSLLNKSYFSNSPECLFQIEGDEIETMPIKGTIKVRDDLKVKIKELKSSLKNESELNMITDLLLHDINGLTHFNAYVFKKKGFLSVPGLIHSYSSIKGPLKNQNLLKILSCLYPGGSITGAPKKRVREIIKNLESFDRGFYCGSTIIKSGKLFAGSINIRSLTIDEVQKSIQYGAGGGVTIASTVEDEFEELLAKLNSFSKLVS